MTVPAQSASRFRRRGIIALAAAILAGLVFFSFSAWSDSHRNPTWASAMQNCRVLYARTHTRADTLAVDQTPSMGWSTGEDRPRRCGELRISHAFDSMKP